MQPLITVVIPTYNRADKLKRAVESVLNQTESDLEVLVIDDGSSSDAARQVIEGFLDARVRYIYQDHAGACAARNRGVQLAKGEYIAFQDSDDLWRRDKLRRQLACVKETGADVVYGRLEKICPDGSTALYPAHPLPGFLGPGDSPFGIGTQTLLAKREVFLSCLFAPAMPRFQELEWLCRVRKAYKVYGMKDALVDYAPGEDSISGDTGALLCASELLLQKHPELTLHSPAARQTLIDCLLSEAERAYNRGDARWRDCLKLAARVGGHKENSLAALGRLGGYGLYVGLKDAKIKKRLKSSPPVKALRAVKRTLSQLGEAEALRRFPEKRRAFGGGWALCLLFSQSIDILTRWHTSFYHKAIRRFCDGEFSDLARRINNQPVEEAPASGPLPVWTLWWDGEENAPECVRLCMKSQRRFFSAPDYAWRLLTKDNYDRYITLNPIFLERFQRGEISLTHLSDVIRCELLRRYGGLWMDATVYVSGPPDKKTLTAPFFTNRKTTYPENLRRLIPAGRWACYLMGCRAGAPLTAFLTEAYRLYWEKYGEALDYYLLDDLLDAAWRLIPAARERLEKAVTGNQRIFDLYEARNEAYIPDKIEALFCENVFHKLSYKDEYKSLTPDGKRTVWARMREDAGDEI